MKTLSDWQLSRVRDALDAYYRYNRDSEGHSPRWNDVWEEIADAAEEKGITLDLESTNGAERLRQFVVGLGKKGKSPKYPKPHPQLMQAIVAFVTDEHSALLSKEELFGYEPPLQAALRLREYLQQKFDNAYLPAPEAAEGCYRTSRVDAGDLLVRELTIQRASAGGILQVVETDAVYDGEIAAGFDKLSRGERREKRRTSERYAGWAILTPEYNLLFFLKEERTGMNRYYFTLASDLPRELDRPMTKLALLHHDYPFEPDEGGSDPLQFTVTALTEELSKSIFVFERC